MTGYVLKFRAALWQISCAFKVGVRSLLAVSGLIHGKGALPSGDGGW